MHSNRMARPKRRSANTHTPHSPLSTNRFARWLGPELWRAFVAIISCGLLLQQLPHLAHVSAQSQQTISLEAEQHAETKVRLSWRINNPGSIIAIRILRSETSPLTNFQVIGTTGIGHGFHRQQCQRQHHLLLPGAHGLADQYRVASVQRSDHQAAIIHHSANSIAHQDAIAYPRTYGHTQTVAFFHTATCARFTARHLRRAAGRR